MTVFINFTAQSKSYRALQTKRRDIIVLKLKHNAQIVINFFWFWSANSYATGSYSLCNTDGMKCNSIATEVFRKQKCNIPWKWYPKGLLLWWCFIQLAHEVPKLPLNWADKLGYVKTAMDDNKLDNHTSWVRIRPMCPIVSYSFSLSVDR